VKRAGEFERNVRKRWSCGEGAKSNVSTLRLTDGERGWRSRKKQRGEKYALSSPAVSASICVVSSHRCASTDGNGVADRTATS
jgi:hypothetical protein